MPPEIAAVFEALSAYQLIIWGAFIIAVCVAIYKAWPVVTRFVRTVNALGELPEFITATSDTLERHSDTLATIKHEVLPNNGGSLRDEVDRQGVRLIAVDEKLAADNDRIYELERTIPRDQLGRFTKKE